MEDTSLTKSMRGYNVILICGNDDIVPKSMEEISDQAIFKNSWEKSRLLAIQDITLLSWLPLMKGVEEAVMFPINILKEAPIGKHTVANHDVVWWSAFDSPFKPLRKRFINPYKIFVSPLPLNAGLSNSNQGSTKHLFGVEEAVMFLINILKETPIGKVVRMGRKMKEMVGSFSSFISNFYKSKTLKFAQEAQVSDTKSTKQEKSRGWVFLVPFLVLFLVLSTGPKGVRCEDIGNPLVPGSTAMNSFLADKYLRGGARHLAAAIDYKVLSHGYPRSNTPGREKVNPHERPQNPEDHYRQGNTGKH
ncbi:hypothetical protein EPI10_025602 [Gossypium australe]|uniref:Uncharacterized protein n=1 Tax=Gossypium australe TaxID=47621 RepID=A0A5B6W2J6_9ROSI|nr:hypothetical protein EPI10_025602 [Gossypium australe]